MALRTLWLFAVAGFTMAGFAPHVSADDDADALQPAPPLSIGGVLQGPDAEQLSWEHLRGSVVVLEFWTTWCVPCVEAIPHLNELAEHFADKPVQFIAISSEDAEAVDEFLEKNEMKAWVVVDDERETFNAYNVTGIPRTFLIDAEGKVRAQTHPIRLDKPHIEQVLAGETPALESAPVVGRNQPLPGVDPGASGDEEALFQVIIRRAEEPGGMWDWARAAGAVTLIGRSAAAVIRAGYDHPANRTDLTGDFGEGYYTLIARMPDGFEDQLRPMIRQAVEMTFNVESWYETRKRKVLVLEQVADDAANGLEPSNSDMNRVGFRRGTWELTGVEIGSGMVNVIETFTRSLVVDETGLEGRFDLTLDLGEDASPMPDEIDRESLNEQLREQLGLQLRDAERKIEYLVIRPRAVAAAD